MNPFRFAILGSGEIASFYMSHFHARADKRGVEFAGVCDLIEERGQAFTKKFGGKFYPSLDQMLTDKSIDAVVNLTMPPTHAPLSRKCLQAGKHVHVEKPLALNLADGIEVVKLAQQMKLTLSCSPFILLGQTQQQVKRLIKDGSIGKPLVVTADQYHGRIESWNTNAERFYRDSGGPILDVGPYPLSLMVDWLGPVESVRSMCATLLPKRQYPDGRTFDINVFDHATAMLRFKCGTLGRIDISNANIKSDLHGIEVHGSSGSIGISAVMDGHGELRMSRKDAANWETREGDPSPKPASGVDWATGIFELAASVRENRAPANSGAMALHVLQVLLAIQQAAVEGREIVIAELL
jgi:predicted dehydrogenase